MIRKLLFPVLLAGLLGGCISTGYGYRDDYYYGQPSVEYRYYGYGYPQGYGDYPYGYGYPYTYGYYPYGGHYGYYHYYGYPYYGYPYRYGHGYPYYPPYSPYRHPRPPVSGKPRPPHVEHGGNLPPWRELDRRRMGDIAGDALRTQGTMPPRPEPATPNRPEPATPNRPETATPNRPEPVTQDVPRREPRNEGSRTGQAPQRSQEPRRRQSGNVHEPN